MFSPGYSVSAAAALSSVELERETSPRSNPSAANRRATDCPMPGPAPMMIALGIAYGLFDDRRALRGYDPPPIAVEGEDVRVAAGGLHRGTVRSGDLHQGAAHDD